MKKLFSILMIVVLLMSSVSFIAFAQENDTVYSLEVSEDKYFSYYKDSNGEPYIIENGIKYNIAVLNMLEKLQMKHCLCSCERMLLKIK